MNKLSVEERRNLWLAFGKQVALILVERQDRIRDMCPHGLPQDAEEKKEILKQIAAANQNLIDLSGKMADLEKGEPLIGGDALIGKHRCDVTTRNVIVLLTLSRLSPSLGREADDIASLIELVAGDDPTVALSIRNLFGMDGVMRPYIHVERFGSNRDRWYIGLTEESFCSVLALEPDQETIAMTLESQNSGRRRRR